MYEHEDAHRTRDSRRAQAQDTPADERDARAQARRALQDAYDWRDDEPRAAAGSSPGPAAARAEAAHGRQVSRSISRTVAV